MSETHAHCKAVIASLERERDLRIAEPMREIERLRAALFRAATVMEGWAARLPNVHLIAARELGMEADIVRSTLGGSP